MKCRDDIVGKSDENFKKEDDVMSALAEYLVTNKNKAYAFATSNTKCNEDGRPVISKDDEWLGETEWDDLFQLLANKTQKGE